MHSFARVPDGGAERRGGRIAPMLLVLLTLVAMGRLLFNEMVGDDLLLIAWNRSIQSWSGLWHGFTTPYWPPPSTDGLYRPLMLAAFTLEWKAGGGQLVIFHLASLVLYAADTLLLWDLLRRWVRPAAAFCAAALFAVHPVHTEAVAQGVNQGELAVALIALLMIRALVDAEARGGPTRATGWGMFCGQVLALGFKEHAVVIPVLCALVLFLGGPDGRAALRRWRTPLLAMVAATIGFWGVRATVLGGVSGVAPAVGFPESFLGRAQFVLGVVPTWVHLLLWPSRLLIDYSPRVLPPWSGEGAAPILGAVLIAAAGVAIRWSWRRAPKVALGLLWIGVAIAPVSNLLLPTGTLLGERTLFLGSVGATLLAALLLDTAMGRGHARPAALVTGLLVALGAMRSYRRMPDWRDRPAQIDALLRDAPEDFRAQLSAGTWAFDSLGDRRTGEQRMRTAIAIWPDHPEPYRALADRYRGDGLCTPAVPLYAEAVRRWPGRDDLRISLIACLFHEGEWREAATWAREAGPAHGAPTWFDQAAHLADSAAAAHAPAGAVAPPAARPQLLHIGPGA